MPSSADDHRADPEAIQASGPERVSVGPGRAALVVVLYPVLWGLLKWSATAFKVGNPL